MHKWINEDWEFTITVMSGKADYCRLGIEEGDTFRCQYEVPTGFCPKTMPILYTLCEIVRCGGNYISRGSKNEYEIDFPCADSVITFHLQAKHI
ncbi:MAG: TIGR04076 family protein [Eubacterium sp.]|nr:TIGR04076 family protein [Eubacterium sp.]